MWRLQTQKIHILKQSHCVNRKILQSCYNLMKTYPGSEVPLQKSPANRAKKGNFASLARTADGFLGLGRPALVLEPLIQGNVNQYLLHPNEQLSFCYFFSINIL